MRHDDPVARRLAELPRPTLDPGLRDRVLDRAGAALRPASPWRLHLARAMTPAVAATLLLALAANFWIDGRAPASTDRRPVETATLLADELGLESGWLERRLAAVREVPALPRMEDL